MSRDILSNIPNQLNEIMRAYSLPRLDEERALKFILKNIVGDPIAYYIKFNEKAEPHISIYVICKSPNTSLLYEFKYASTIFSYDIVNIDSIVRLYYNEVEAPMGDGRTQRNYHLHLVHFQTGILKTNIECTKADFKYLFDEFYNELLEQLYGGRRSDG